METFSALLALCAGNSPVTGEIPAQRTVTRSFDVFFDLRLNKRLSKHSWGWWSETPSRPLWRHCNMNRIYKIYDQNTINLLLTLRTFIWGPCNVMYESMRGSQPGARLNIKTVFPGTGFSIIKVRRSSDRLIFIMEIPILVRYRLYIETTLRLASSVVILNIFQNMRLS